VKKIVLMLFSFLVWCALTWNFGVENLVAGSVVAVTVGLIFGKRFLDEPLKVFNPLRWLYMLLYAFVFLFEMAKANLQVAYLVLHPKMPINPGIVRVKTGIKSELGRTFLANSITLTPGTFTIDIKKDILYIHCIVVPATDLDEATKHIVQRFEKLLIKIFD
jgi:multicomponent Na+:H+ antiporter subunit E